MGLELKLAWLSTQPIEVSIDNTIGSTNVMNIIKNQDRILEAIDQLRRRKARPDAERICNFVLRRFSVNTQDTKADLKRLVDADIVVKVEYKGNTSYRNAAKWSRFAVYNKNKEETLGINQGLASLSSGIAELIIQEPDYLDFGVPVIELKKFMQHKDKPLFTEQNFELILEHEVIAGNLVKLENGNYSLADHPVPSSSRVNNSIDNDVKMLKIESSSSSNQHSDDDNDTSLSQANNKVKNSLSKTTYNSNKNIPVAAVNLSLSSDRPTETSVMPVGGYRVGGRRKRAKKVFDPSDNNLPTRKRGRPFGSLNKCKDPSFSSQNKLVESAVGVCYICHQRSNRRGNYEKLISCRDCTHRGVEGAHMPAFRLLSAQARSLGALCKSDFSSLLCMGRSEGMVICSGCDEGFHFSCHSPRLSERVKNSKWFCHKCSLLQAKSSPVHAPGKGVAPSRESSIPDSIIKKYLTPPDPVGAADSDEPIDERIPDASSWSVDQVEEYLIEQGLPNQAAVFKEHKCRGTLTTHCILVEVNKTTNLKAEHTIDSNKVKEKLVTFLDLRQESPDDDDDDDEEYLAFYKSRLSIDIDGPSLLLMKRNDVLCSLSLKLGPALKIYKHVKMLQIRRRKLDRNKMETNTIWPLQWKEEHHSSHFTLLPMDK
uniref:Uncharacterized protein n=1 Tax=Timema poppense TaxID=170557 RepID=A0A7R9DIG2_TIMPO|nr:unnamed protein product [Timema poppensis]